MVISKTFSKVLASAGLRVGMLITHPRSSTSSARSQLPFNVSQLTQAVAVKIARDEFGDRVASGALRQRARAGVTRAR